MTAEVHALIADLRLAPHPEGGWYRETYRSDERVVAGAPLAIEVITPPGRYERHHVQAAGPWQATVPAGAHFAAHLEPGGAYALVGCDVAPGFEFSDFAISSRAALLAAYPQYAPLIVRWTR